MNFSSHVKNLRFTLNECLSYDKHEMLETLRDCLVKAKALLKTTKFDFYLEQFKQLEIYEFATTHYGVNEAKRLLKRSIERNGNSQSALTTDLLWASENIMTYTVDDCCEMQSEFHWYYCIDGDFAFKESELGMIEAPNNLKVRGTCRIAKISELPSIIEGSLI